MKSRGGLLVSIIDEGRCIYSKSTWDGETKTLLKDFYKIMTTRLTGGHDFLRWAQF